MFLIFILSEFHNYIFSIVFLFCVILRFWVIQIEWENWIRESVIENILPISCPQRVTTHKALLLTQVLNEFRVSQEVLWHQSNCICISSP